jgi:hypothetical protein
LSSRRAPEHPLSFVTNPFIQPPAWQQDAATRRVRSSGICLEGIDTCRTPHNRERDRRQGVVAVTVKITPNDRGNPPGKLADAELHFAEGPLEGLKLIGFSIWEQRRGGGGGRNVTFPARQYNVNGERRSFALLRPIVDSTAQNRVRDLILEAYAVHADAMEATA